MLLGIGADKLSSVMTVICHFLLQAALMSCTQLTSDNLLVS